MLGVFVLFNLVDKIVLRTYNFHDPAIVIDYFFVIIF